MDTAALKDSWQLVAKSGDDVPLYFYSHLFLSHPDLRAMFPISMAAQRDKLVGALGRIVSHVDQLEQVTSFIEQLGRDHRRFSVIAGHYDAVGASLLATLKHFLGAAWSEELAADWAAAYGVVASVMVDAAEDAAASTPAWWDGEIVSVDRRTMDITVLQIRPDPRFDYLPGQSFAMELAKRPRLWRYYSPGNAPREDGSLELHVQRVDGGQVSGALVRSVGPGDTVKLGAPVGDQLTWSATEQGNLLMVAGGTGLAPLRAVVEQIDTTWQVEGSGPRVHLFHGVRVPWNLYEGEWLQAMAARWPWFDYTPVVSDDRSYPGARGPVGSVAAGSGPWHGRIAMVCGGPQMVAHTVGELTAADLPMENIRYEQFEQAAAGDSDGELSRSGGHQ